MNLKKEDFGKLKQLDRIEFLLKLENTEKQKNNSHFHWYIITNGLCFMIAFLVLCFLINEKLIGLFRLATPLLYLAFMIMIIGTLYNLINGTKHKKYLKELYSEYFKVEVKK